MSRLKPGGRGRDKLPIAHSGFAPYLQRYLENRRINHYSADSLQRYDSSLRQFIVWCDDRGLDSPTAITRPILERYKKHLFYSRKANGEPLSISSQSVKLATLKAWFTWLTRENYLLYNPASELTLPRRPQRLPSHILSLDNIHALMNSADIATPEGLRDRAIMELLYSSGLRRKECADLQLTAIDLRQGTVFVRAGKGGKDRLLPLGDRACRWLDKYLHDSRPVLLVDWRAEALFIDNYGGAYNADCLGRVVKKHLKLAGIDVPGGAHLLRHAMATHMLENGADIRFIQAMLGHADLRATEVYTRVSVAKLREIHRATHPGRLKAAQTEGTEGL